MSPGKNFGRPTPGQPLEWERLLPAALDDHHTHVEPDHGCGPDDMPQWCVNAYHWNRY